MRSIFQTLLMLGIMLLSVVGSAQAQSKWLRTHIDGQDYVKLSDVWRYYGFSKTQGRTGFLAYGAGNRVVSLRPSRQDFYVNDYRYVLSFPVQEREGQLYISTVDMEKLVDPVLRPRLAASRDFNTVVLDPGHGGHDAGARSRYAVEKDCNLSLALKVRDKLRKAGFKVVMTRDSDFFLTLGQRVVIANQTPNSIFVSIHHNSDAGKGTAYGIETFTLAPHGTTSPFARTRRTEDLMGNHQDSENIALATAVHSHAIKRTSAFDRGIQRARFSVLCTIQRPAILFEGGFVTHPREGSKISSSEYQNLLAQCICEGIMRYKATAKGSGVATRNSTPPPRATSVRISGSKTPTR